MRKVAAVFGVLAFLLVLSGTRPDPLHAQNPKVAGGKIAATKGIQITEGNDGKFRFYVRDDGGTLLAMSGPTGYESAGDAETAVQRLKEVLKTAKVRVVKKSGKIER